MVDKELIEIWRNELKPSISLWLLNTNYKEMGEQDKEEFERDFDKILDLALIGLKHKAQLSQEGTTKDATSDTISRQAAITALSHMCSEDEKGITVSRANVDSMLKSLLPAQPERRWIPCSEKLPEEEIDVLVTRKFLGCKDSGHGWNNHMTPKTYVEVAQYFCGEWEALSDEYKIARNRHTNPIAWMPLPEPYQDGE